VTCKNFAFWGFFAIFFLMAATIMLLESALGDEVPVLHEMRRMVAGSIDDLCEWSRTDGSL
jgi:hypothetical protein